LRAHNRSMHRNIPYSRAFEGMKLARYSATLIIITVFAGTIAAPSQSFDQSNVNSRLVQAVSQRDIHSVRQLLDAGADIESRDQNGETSLISAADSLDLELLELLLEKGADISARDNEHETALVHAARTENPGAVEVLLAKTADYKEKNEALIESVRGGPVVIQMADTPTGAQTGHVTREIPDAPWVKTVRLLLDNGADIEARDDEGATPLISAAAYGQIEIFELLIQRGASIRARDKRGMTPLMAAACECALSTMNSTYDIVRILLEKGANVNAQDHDGVTALMTAAAGFGSAAIVRLLLDHGANPAARNKRGETALTLAAQQDRQDKVRLLKKAMSKAR
jgi:ankyrin repeat protein